MAGQRRRSPSGESNKTRAKRASKDRPAGATHVSGPPRDLEALRPREPRILVGQKVEKTAPVRTRSRKK